MPKGVNNIRLLFVFLVSLLVPIDISATNADEINLTCPVCGTPCRGRVIVSTDTYGGQDRDLFTRASGIQPIQLTPVTCPKCCYSEYTQCFENPVNDDIRYQILMEKALIMPEIPPRQETPERESSGIGNPARDVDKIPAWVKHDLIGQVMALKKEDPKTRAWQFMTTAWAVRVEQNPFEPLLRRLSKDDASWLEKQPIPSFADDKGNRTERFRKSLEAALVLLSGISTYPAERRRAAAITGGYLLRFHGEHENLLRSMPILEPFFPKEEWVSLSARVASSVFLERKYQRRAVILFERMVSAKGDLDQETRGVFVYIIGELSRRLGDPLKALIYYEDVLNMEGVSDKILRYAREQKDHILKKSSSERLGSATLRTMRGTR
jgi:hypothetical protein